MSAATADPHAFAAAWIQQLQSAEPLAIVARSDDPLSLTVNLPGAITVSTQLHELWRSRHEHALSPLLQTDIQALLDFRQPLLDSEQLRAMLRPAVLPQETIVAIAPHAVGAWPVAGALQALLMLDANSRQRPVLAEERPHLGERPLRVAVSNLVNALGAPSYSEVGQGLWRVHLDGRNESSLLLLAGLWDLLEEELNDTLIVAHPSADVLLVVRQGDVHAMQTLGQAAHNTSLLRWQQHSWQTLEPYRRCAVCAWAAQAWEVRCPSCGTPLDEDRFLAWLVGSLALGVLWVLFEQRLGVVLPRPFLVQALLSALVVGVLGYAVSLWRAVRAEPWRPVLRDTEANLLDRTIRVPVVLALALGWAYLPQLLPQLQHASGELPLLLASAALLRDAVATTLLLGLPIVLIYRHGPRWLDPRPPSTLDISCPP